jgi:FtsH-binding integral membrane protein
MSVAIPSETEDGGAGVFGQVMGLVATTLGVFTLGAYLGRHLAGGPSLICFLIGFGCIFGLNYARGSGGAGIGLLAAVGLFLGLGLGGALDAYASADPGVVWQAGAATALFVAALGSIGHMIRSDLSGGYRVLFFLLLALIVYGLISLFVSMPAGNVVYAVLGLGIFGGYTLLDFNRLRNAGNGDAVSIATGIFLDVLNVFTFFLQLFGRGRD